jgi:predicted ribosomally synthesized peptide with SipW-like signal peptide
MSDHRATSRTHRGWFTSVRIRALLSLGIALGIGSVGTFAFWTDDVVISGTTFSAGTIDLRVNGADSLPTYTTLNMSNAVPGNTIAGVLTIRNQGSAPLKYTATTTASNADGKNVRGSLTVKVTAATTVTGTYPTATCGGAAITGFATSFTAAAFLTPGRLLAPTTEEQICVQVTLDATAPSALQGGTTSVGFTFTGTSDLS